MLTSMDPISFWWRQWPRCATSDRSFMGTTSRLEDMDPSDVQAIYTTPKPPGKISKVASFAAMTRSASQATLNRVESAAATLKRVFTVTSFNNPLKYWSYMHPEVRSRQKDGDMQVYAKIPDFVGQTILSLLIFIMGATMKGNRTVTKTYHKW